MTEIAQQIPDTAEIGVAEALEWALYRLRWSNNELRNYLAKQTPPVAQLQNNPERLSPQSPPPQGMKRPSEPVNSDPASNRSQSRRPSIQGSRLFPIAGTTDERWRNADQLEPSAAQAAHHRTTSISAGPQFSRTESPSNAPHSALMLPSPTSLNLPVPPGQPSISSPNSYPQSAAHAAHLQDLQHQVSVKTLALQTLQREYDSLLQKLERMRTKCATLEKKFEVSDAEINSLTDERERLEKQVETLEKQLEDTQNARDEARSTSAEQASQYMKIMEMAGRLQAQAAEDRRKWETERETLLSRVADLQAGDRGVRGTKSSNPPHRPTSSRVDLEVGHDEKSLSRADLEADLDEKSPDGFEESGIVDPKAKFFQTEMKKLEVRVQNLENALHAAQEESKIVREAAVTLASVGQRMEIAAEKVRGGPG